MLRRLYGAISVAIFAFRNALKKGVGVVVVAVPPSFDMSDEGHKEYLLEHVNEYLKSSG